MECKFDFSKCSPECKKFSLCSCIALQEKINIMLNSINNLTMTVSSIYLENEKTKQELEDKLNLYTGDMLDLISQLRKRRKGPLK